MVSCSMLKQEVDIQVGTTSTVTSSFSDTRFEPNFMQNAVLLGSVT